MVSGEPRAYGAAGGGVQGLYLRPVLTLAQYAHDLTMDRYAHRTPGSAEPLFLNELADVYTALDHVRHNLHEELEQRKAVELALMAENTKNSVCAASRWWPNKPIAPKANLSPP